MLYRDLRGADSPGTVGSIFLTFSAPLRFCRVFDAVNKASTRRGVCSAFCAEGGLRQMVADLGLPTCPIVELFADLAQVMSEPVVPLSAPARSLAAFVAMVQNCGFEALCILVDKWDEIHETAEKPAVLAQLLEPLLADLHVMETPGAVFKCFLPNSVLEPLKAYSSVRFDRLRVCEIRWSDYFLTEMLNRRLITYSRGRIRSLAQICGASLAESIDQEIVKWAAGVPRHLLQFGALLFEAQVQAPGETPLLITNSTWRKATPMPSSPTICRCC